MVNSWDEIYELLDKCEGCHWNIFGLNKQKEKGELKEIQQKLQMNVFILNRRNFWLKTPIDYYDSRLESSYKDLHLLLNIDCKNYF